MIADKDIDMANPNFLNELSKQPGGEMISACFMCGNCTAICPITTINDRFNPLRIIRLALLGLKEEVLATNFIWYCTSCYSCQETCPHGVKITEFMTLLKNMAIREGIAPSGIKTQMNTIKKTGRVYSIDKFDNKKREKSDLPAIPTSCEVTKKLFSS